MSWRSTERRFWDGYGRPPRYRITDKPMKKKMIDLSVRFYRCLGAPLLPKGYDLRCITLGELNYLCNHLGCQPNEVIGFELLT